MWVGGKKYIVVVSEGLLERMGEERKWESAKQKQSESACVSVSKVTGRTGQRDRLTTLDDSEVETQECGME